MVHRPLEDRLRQAPRKRPSLAQTDKEHLAASGYRRYQKALQAAGAVDFDDLLLCVEQLFTRFQKVRAVEAARFDHLLVDEYQDTNGSQYRIVKALAGGHRNLCVVGDDDQSIYGWRGAEVAHILGFKKDWPDAKVVRLETNYRSTREIVAWANRLIAFNSQRHAKTLRANASGEPPRVLQLEDETKEAKALVEEIAAADPPGPPPSARLRRPLPHERAAAGVRAGASPRKIPYVLLGGMSFYDRKEVRDILAYFKVLANPCDEVSLLRIINTPARGIGKSAVKRLLERAIERRKPLWEVLPEAATPAVAEFRDMIGQFQRRVEKGPLPAAVRELIAKIAYRDEIARLYPDANEQQSRWQSIEEVVNAVAGYAQRAKQPTLAGFLQDVALAGTEQDKRNRNWSGTPLR